VDVHRVFDILRVPEGEFNRLKASFDYYYQLHQAYQTIVLLLVGCQKLYRYIILLYGLTCLKLTTKSAIF